MSSENSQLIADDNSIRLQLRKLHSVGLWNVTSDEVPALVTLPVVAKQIPRYSHEALRIALQDLFERVLERMSANDRQAVTVLFGLPPHAATGPKNRHKLLPGIVNQPWSQYRSSPFDNLLRRLIQAINAVNENAPLATSIVPSRKYRLISLKQQYLEPTSAHPVLSVIEQRKVKVEANELTTWAQNYRLQLVSASAHPSIRHIGDGRFTVETIELSGQEGAGFELELRVDFVQPLARGDIFEFTIIKDIPVDVEKYRTSPGTFHTGFTAGLEIDELEITLTLDPDRSPASIRKISGALPSKRFQEELDEMEILELGDRTTMCESWKDLTWQRWYGLVW